MFIYKAFYNMYCNMKSRVKCHGLYSDWFTVLQGTRQGGISSPTLYLIYIDGLIKTLQDSGYGLCIFDKSFACPTVADDMCLVSFSKKGLDLMMNICYEYSCRWRFDYNHNKCAVVVFNENVKEYKTNKRIWKLGQDIVLEKDKYVHLGILCNKYMDLDANVEDCKS